MPDVCAEEILTVYGGGDVGEDCLDVPLYGILPLLIWGGALVSALVIFVECVCFCGSESGVIVAAQDSRFVASSGEES